MGVFQLDPYLAFTMVTVFELNTLNMSNFATMRARLTAIRLETRRSTWVSLSSRSVLGANRNGMTTEALQAPVSAGHSEVLRATARSGRWSPNSWC